MYHPVVKVVNIKKMDPSAYNIYIGRKSHISAKVLYENPLLIDGTSLGNPFPIGDGCTREQAIESYRHYFYSNRGLFEGLLCNLLKEAKRRTVCLVCWCAPKPCHGDVIAEYLNGSTRYPSPYLLIQENLFEE